MPVPATHRGPMPMPGPMPVPLWDGGRRVLRISQAEAARAPCHACTVNHLCLPKGLDAAQRESLDGLSIGRRRLRKGQKLYRQGDPFLFLYAVRFGTCKASFSLGDGGEHVSAFHLAGDLMGFDGLADNTYATTITALESCEVCALPYAQLVEACAASPALRQRLSQLMGAQLVREYLATKLVAHRHTEARVAGFLLQLSKWMQERGYSPREFRLRMSRADIGSYLGTTLETVSRCMSQFAREGHIRVHSRDVQLVNPEGLRVAYVDESGA